MPKHTFTIDSQVHSYERNSSARPWLGFLQGPDKVTGDDMVEAMDAVGVDGALLVSPFSLYCWLSAQMGQKVNGDFELISRAL